MKSIRARLLVLLLSGLVAVLVIGGAAVYWIEEANLTAQLDEIAVAQARTLASFVSYEPPRLLFDSEDADRLEGPPYELRTISGELLKRSGSLGDTSLPTRAPQEGAWMTEDLELAMGPVLRGRAAWLAFVPHLDEHDHFDGKSDAAALGSSPPELLVMAVVVDRSTTDHALTTFLTALLIVGAGAIATVVGLVLLGIRWGLAPLERLRLQVGAVGNHTIHKGFDDHGAPNELIPIYQELNGMLQRVRATIERERSFADAAAHELRTPLAELRSTTEVALRWPEAGDVLQSLREVLAIGGDLEQLVAALLMISRGDAMASNGTPERTCLGPIIDACLGRHAAAIEDKRLELAVDVDRDAFVAAPPEAMEIIVRNIIDNAVRYTPPGGSMRVAARSERSRESQFVVENGPVDVRDEDLPRLFEAFWRTDGARSDRRHVGLGLTVVQRITTAFSMQVATALCDGRLRVTILPGTTAPVH